MEARRGKGEEDAAEEVDEDQAAEEDGAEERMYEVENAEETRMDGEAGQFTLQEFVDFYGGSLQSGLGIDQWNKAAAT